MKVRVISAFADRYDTKIVYKVGDILDWDDQDRITECEKRGLIKAMPEKVKAKVVPRKPKTTK